MTTQSEKDNIIRQVYYNEDGFGSITETYRKANNILNTITVANVKEFLDKQKGRQVQDYRGYNSYVAPEPLHEIQIDLATFTDSASDNSGFKYAFVAIDVFTKYMWVVAIKDKQPAENVRAMKEVLDKIGIPKQIMGDDEGAWNSTEFIRLLNSHNIKKITTSRHAPFAERAIQEFKNMVHARLEGLEIDKEKWIDLIQPILKKYNSRKHGTTGLSPNDARDPTNKIQVYYNIASKAVYNRKYPPLSLDSLVRTAVKKKTFTKGYDSKWSKEVYKIIHISNDGKQYLVNDGKRRVYNRWELLKISGAQGKDG